MKAIEEYKFYDRKIVRGRVWYYDNRETIKLSLQKYTDSIDLSKADIVALAQQFGIIEDN